VAEFGRVAVITKATADEGCTTYAQGGVCAVLDPLDSVAKHVQDTMVAGAHLNNPGYVSCDPIVTCSFMLAFLRVAFWILPLFSSMSCSCKACAEHFCAIDSSHIVAAALSCAYCLQKAAVCGLEVDCIRSLLAL